jgi:hypothetical protein
MMLRLLYGVLVVAVVSLALIFLQDVLAALEAEEHAGEEDGGLHHLFIFDLAFPVFLFSTLVTLVGGVVALILGLVRHLAPLRRYAVFALTYSLLAVAVAFLIGGLEL